MHDQIGKLAGASTALQTQSDATIKESLLKAGTPVLTLFCISSLQVVLLLPLNFMAEISILSQD
jgi:hypothetical protein